MIVKSTEPGYPLILYLLKVEYTRWRLQYTNASDQLLLCQVKSATPFINQGWIPARASRTEHTAHNNQGLPKTLDTLFVANQEAKLKCGSASTAERFTSAPWTVHTTVVGYAMDFGQRSKI